MSDLGQASTASVGARLGAIRQRVFYGWWMTAAMCALLTYGAGAFFHGFSVFFNPIATEFGWTRAVTAGAFSLSRLEGGIEGPLSGWLTDRLGARKVILFGLLSVAIGYVALSFVHSLWTFYFVYGVLLSFGFNTGFFRPCQQVVVNWFRRRRGMALGLMMTAPGLGGALVVPIMAWLVVQFDWRVASLVVGGGFLLIGLPAALFVRDRPQDLGLALDGDAPVAEAEGASSKGHHHSDSELSLSVGEALRSSAFWVFGLFMTLRMFGSTAALVHMIPLLEDRGFEPVAAASATAFASLVSVPSRFFCGWLGDRFDKRLLLIVVLLLEGSGVLILALIGSTSWVYPAMVLWGLGQGSAPLHSALRADYFGPRHFALITGLVSPLTMIGSVAGPVLAGYAFDVTGSYTQALIAISITFALSAIGVLFLRPPKQMRPALP